MFPHFHLSSCFQLNLRGPSLFRVLLKGQKGSQRSACWDIEAVAVVVIARGHFIAAAAAAWGQEKSQQAGSFDLFSRVTGYFGVKLCDLKYKEAI